ncbi:hydroperoxide isomerase ALOXE3-like isoform X1 [Heteronotia binoei]|uniref:hydroperoxide isomerase ALOXE3-like isoform X1 n=1 Tax=Heteronotia binoei TaxID=13085 RepID=UPI00292DF202|nr:hydroperoxide isomerase ALOXE3-like isoform X1 [Heteronotia binoei]
MATYKIRVATGDYLCGGTMDSVAITLVGIRGESPKFRLDRPGKDFSPGEVDEYVVQTEHHLGSILLIRLHKERYSIFPHTNWNCSFVEVLGPREEVYRFPCYQWIVGYTTLELREGTAKTIREDANNQLLLRHRKEELRAKRQAYRYKEFQPGWPKCLDVDTVDQLNLNDQYSSTKTSTLEVNLAAGQVELKLKGLLDCKKSWNKLDDVRRAFWFYRSPASEYVSRHWDEDAFFGYQYLNGVNPVFIRKCTEIPAKFPVTQEMVAKSLEKHTTLDKELEKGNLFLIDCQILEGTPATKLNGRRQHIAAPICLLRLNPWGELVPIAIQLTQQPGPESPIFLPSDSEWDWGLAKFWVRNATFHIHEVLTHLLYTHLMAEVFTLATIRHLPMCHPLYKLLIPHTRYTLHINVLGRVRLFGPGGLIDEATATGFHGLSYLLAKGLSTLTYSTLCLPDDLRDRGVESLPNYYYKEDGMKLWEAIHSFVSGIVCLYYPDDISVREDPELQAWVAEIFDKGPLGRESSGFPSRLETIGELTKFLTMVIFTGSIRHASVNNGQFDFGAWMPNYPSSMRKPPPKTKGSASFGSILETLPDVSTTCRSLLILWLLSKEPGDRNPLGCYPAEHFTEEKPKRVIAAFQKRLAQISKEIDERNRQLPLPYNYLNPPEIENSTSI